MKKRLPNASLFKTCKIRGKYYTGFSQEKRAVFYKVFDIFPANRRISVEKNQYKRQGKNHCKSHQKNVKKGCLDWLSLV